MVFIIFQIIVFVFRHQQLTSRSAEFSSMQTNVTKFFTVFFLLLCIGTNAQTDSATFVNTEWHVEKLAAGIEWKSFHFENKSLFSANENVNIIQISPKQKQYSMHVVHSDSLEPTSQLAMRNNALAAINGSFFKMRGPDPDDNKKINGKPVLEPSKLDHNRSVVYLREGNVVIAENHENNNVRKRHQQGSITINKSKVSIVKDSADINWEHHLHGEDVLSTGPVIILSGIDQKLPNDAFDNNRHPRTAIGKKADGTVVLLVVDGRAGESAGMSIPELQKIFRWLHCTDAINLDGGGSTSMYVKGQPFHGVVNYPSDNSKFDHEGEREVANALVIVPR
jgi:exopolysaccharide biosynthesis protein